MCTPPMAEFVLTPIRSRYPENDEKSRSLHRSIYRPRRRRPRPHSNRTCSLKPPNRSLCRTDGREEQRQQPSSGAARSSAAVEWSGGDFAAAPIFQVWAPPPPPSISIVRFVTCANQRRRRRLRSLVYLFRTKGRRRRRSEGVGRRICPVVDGGGGCSNSLPHWTCFSGRPMPQSRRTAAKKLASLGRPAARPAPYSHYARGDARRRQHPAAIVALLDDE